MATQKQIDKYWKERIDNRQYTAEQLGIKAEVSILKIYEKALRNINQDIADVYEKYASKVGLGVDELSVLLNSKEQSDFTRSIQAKMQKLGFNIDDIYLPNYIARLTRLDALKQQIYWKIAEIGAEEEPIHEETYNKIVKDTYKQYQKDVIKTGIKPTFATLDNRMAAQMVKERWYGRNYSDSVWQNTTKLAEMLPEKIGAALTMGRSYMKTANEIMYLVGEDFNNAMYASTRLVRTETIFHLNQAEAQASIDDGFTEYEFYAKVGSERTCEICEGLDGKVFKYNEQKVGVNYPPIHPNCRCSTRSAFKLSVPQMEKLSNKELKERYQISGGRIVPILPELPLSEAEGLLAEKMPKVQVEPEDKLFELARKYKTPEEFDRFVSKLGFGNKSISQMKDYIDQNSRSRLDMDKIESQLEDGGSSYFQVKIDPKDLKIDDIEQVKKNVSLIGDKLSNEPIVVGKDGYIIDGRHRAVRAIINGEQIDAFIPSKAVWQQAQGKQEKQLLDTINPTGTVFTKYDPEARMKMELADNITTLDKTMERSPDEEVTIYRGLPKKYKEINAGDFVTTNKQ